MKLSSFCIKHKVTTIMAYITVVIFGIMSFTQLGLNLMPDMDLPYAIVYAVYGGAGPKEVESQVTEPIEKAVAGISGIDTLSSTSQENMSMVILQFDYGTDMDKTVTDIRDKVDQTKSSLPDDVSSVNVMQVDMNMMPTVAFGLSGADLGTLQDIAEDSLETELQKADGVASVEIQGGYTDEIQIETISEKMKGYNLSVSYLSQMLSAENVAIPGGNVDNGSQTLTVRTTGEYQSIDEIRATRIPLPTGGTVALSEVANVTWSQADQDAYVKVGNTPSIVVSVYKRDGTNTVDVAENAIAAMDEACAKRGLSYTTVLNQADYINKSVDSAISNIIYGVIFAALVLFLFLHDIRATGVISISMPVCIIVVFLLMNVLGLTMNMMSLGGIACGVGMIVDNSIVVLENIFRYRSEGHSVWESCTKGTEEVALSISASTLTTVAVFLPIGLSGGISGMLFKDFCITIVVLLLSSLVIALTLVPLLCYMLLRRNKKTTNPKKRIVADKHKDMAVRPLGRVYAKVLNFLITHRLVGVGITVGLIAFFGLLISGTEMVLIPDMDQGALSVSIEMPTGTDADQVADFTDRVLDVVMEDVPEIDNCYYVAQDESATLSINLVSLKERDRSTKQVANQLTRDLADFAGADITVDESSMSMGSYGGSELDVKISGDDYDTLTQIANDLMPQLEQIEGVVDVESSAEDQTPQVEIVIKRSVASQLGLTTATVGQAVRTELNGSTSTTMKVDGDNYDVIIKGDERSSASLDALKSISLTTATGGTVPLSMVADVNVDLAPQTITRENQLRQVEITGSAEDSNMANRISAEANAILEAYTFPEGYTGETDDSTAKMAESFSSLGLALIVGIFLVYLVLASQFESFVLPIMVMLILPLGLMGSLVGLPLTGNDLSIVAIIGVIILAGTVVNSSIVLIDYIQTRRSRGESKNEAILNACPRRVRPVLMTTLTTILGLVPMAVSTAEGSEMMRPMAIVMITGMVISTIVTLFLTPVYYSLLDSLTAHFKSGDDDLGKSDDDLSLPPDDNQTPPSTTLPAPAQS